MTRAALMNLLGLAAAGVASAMIVARPTAGGPAWVDDGSGAPAPRPGPSDASTTLPDGRRAIRDAAGEPVPVAPYRRIASTSMVTDRLLLELIEPDRVLAVSAATLRTAPWGYRLRGKHAVEGLGAVEELVALKPDLVLMQSFAGRSRIAELRAAGVTAFDAGSVGGVATLLPAIAAVAALLAVPERGDALARGFVARFAGVAAKLGPRPRRRALYLAVVGTRVFGGTVGSSIHDVMTAAGLVDVAAERYRQWPDYSPEQVLALDPEVVVAKIGAAATLCGHPALGLLRACRAPGHVLELPAGLLDDAGLGMLEAAEALFLLAYPEASASP